MNILFTRFPYESAEGGAENQTTALLEGLRARGVMVEFLGSCPVLLRRTREMGLGNRDLNIGKPPVTKWLALSFLWRKKKMKRILTEAIQEQKTRNQEPGTIFMLSLTEKILLTEWAVQQGIKVFWIEHDRIGPWLTRNPWLNELRRMSTYATIICVSELSRKKYLELGFDPKKVVAVPNGVPEPLPLSPDPFPRGGKGNLEKEFHPKKPVDSDILLFARDMRKAPTKAEEFLWEHLRFDQLGVRFRRQHPVERRILDFYCHKCRLGIEIDGPIHMKAEQRIYDRDRTEALKDHEIHILRFTNDEVLGDINQVIEIIKTHLPPPPPGEGQGVGENANNLHLGCLARLSPEKGISVLLEAIADLPVVTLTLVGRGPDEGYIRNLMAEDEKRIGLQRIFLEPGVSTLDTFFSAIDVLVLPSSDHDPFGLVVAEAMVRGVPTILTDACGIAGYLQDGEDALIAKAGSPTSLAAAIKRMEDPKIRERLTKNGKEKAHQQFSVDAMIDSYEHLLKKS
jgi:glycosyltransferase involved in cell wall biosynthesis